MLVRMWGSVRALAVVPVEYAAFPWHWMRTSSAGWSV